MNKQEFIILHMDEYIRMVYRGLINKIDYESEMKLIYNLQYLLDTYSEGELNDYIRYNKTV